MPLADVTALSDEEVGGTSGAPAKPAPGPVPEVSESTPKAKATPKGKAKAKAKVLPRKRPAASAASHTQEGEGTAEPPADSEPPVMKKPARGDGRGPGGGGGPTTTFKAVKYLYHKEGKWGIKQNGKEMTTVKPHELIPEAELEAIENVRKEAEKGVAKSDLKDLAAQNSESLRAAVIEREGASRGTAAEPAAAAAEPAAEEATEEPEEEEPAPKQQAKKKTLIDDGSPTGRSPSSWHTGLRVAATLTCHKAVLAESPPPKSVDIARKMQEQKEAQERDFSYRISRENAFQSTQKFSALKDLLGGL
ncbi:Cation channel sperm-associated protein 1 [Durusdinium trenchii]|uniref:Cation channel sperm-associated protein 1 n=1 Tax=Durusdinium trenchii TaxID=1381693 RepID=A0ABP0P854_9DINO